MLGFVYLIDTVRRSKWWNIEYTANYIFGVFLGVYTLKAVDAPPNTMALIGVTLIVLRLVEKLEGKLVSNLIMCLLFFTIIILLFIWYFLFSMTNMKDKFFNFKDKNSTW